MRTCRAFRNMYGDKNLPKNGANLDARPFIIRCPHASVLWEKALNIQTELNTNQTTADITKRLAA